MTVLLDTWAWIEYIKGSKLGNEVKKYIEGEEEIIINSINISEIYRKLLQDMPNEADNIISMVLNRSFFVFTDIDTSLNAARIKHEKKMGMADAIILATAVAHKAQVVTGDNDFRGLDNVKIIS